MNLVPGTIFALMAALVLSPLNWLARIVTRLKNGGTVSYGTKPAVYNLPVRADNWK